MSETFDYIVIGGGSAGCVLASRLSENPRHRVLLLEAGPKARTPWTRIPVGYFKTVFDPALGWGYSTQAEPNLANRNIVWPRGKLLGGTGAINGMIYVRGQPDDFDTWARLGNPGWGYDDVLPYFRKSETAGIAAAGPNDRWHGSAGPMTVSDYPDQNPLSDAFVNAAVQAGMPHNPDYNGADQYGASYYQTTTNNGLRADPYAAFLKPALHRPNLDVRCSGQVTRIEVRDGRAVAVHYQQNGQQHRVEAVKEIVLSAGAVNSPQILQLSGIGDPAHLSALDIPITAALPGVGQNLQDHLQVQLAYECIQPVSINDDLNSYWRTSRMALRYAFQRRGPIAGGPSPAGAFAKSNSALPQPDLQYHFMPFSMSAPAILDKKSGFSFNVCQLRPKSVGTVRITSQDPSQAPVIHANYLSDPHDAQVLIEGLKLGRRIANSQAFDPFRGAERRPGERAISDEDLLQYTRKTASTIYHPTGTCKMGADPQAVVDHELRVHGITGLRVADASIMPTITSGNTNAPTIMIAEKAAEFMLA